MILLPMAKTHYIVRVNPVPKTRRAPVALVPVTRSGRRLKPVETGIVASSAAVAKAAVRRAGHEPLGHRGSVVLGRHVERHDGEIWYVEIVAVEAVGIRATRLQNPSRRRSRRNPSSLAGRRISASYLKPGDTIDMEDLGRVHVIQGPYRSGRGVRFRDQYDRSLMFAPNEPVRLVARENPGRTVQTEALEQRIIPMLDHAGALTSRTKIRETSRGGLEIKGVDPYVIARDPDLRHRLTRTAALLDYSFRVGPGWVLMLPFELTTQAFPRDSHPNPRGGRRRR